MSPAFPEPATPSRWLTDDELESYERDGVICARGLLDLPLIERLAAALEHVIADANVLGKNLAAGEGFHGDIFVWKLNDEFRDLALFSSLPALANQILRSKQVNSLAAFLQHLADTGFGPGGEKRSLFDEALSAD